MTDQNSQKRGLRTIAFVALFGLLSSLTAAQTPMQATALRTVSGTVTDRAGEPLKGAVVELENQDSHTVISYLTDAAGRYIFKRVDSNTDFVVTAKYRDRRSKPRSISKFNSHLQTVVNIRLRAR